MSDADPEDDLLPVCLPARDIPPPRTISPEAQANLALNAANPPMARPDPSDIAGWRAAIVRSEEMFDPIARAGLASSSATVEEGELGGVRVYVGRPSVRTDEEGPVYLYIHGGAFVFGGGLFPQAQAAVNADRLGCTVISVDYRMPPDHPFPAAPEDSLAVYQALLDQYAPGRIVIGGTSAGGNLAAAATLMIRDRGLPLPAGVILLTPEVDLTEAGDSFRTNELLDVVLKRGLPDCNALYAAGHALTDPYLSPLFADLAGFPPTLVQTGTRDLFLSNSALFHRKLRSAGVEAQLHVWEAMPHGGFGGATPEDAEVFEELRKFIRQVVR